MACTALKTLSTALLISTAAAASAGTSSFTMVSGASAPGINVSLTVQASSTPGFAYDFIVTNNSAKGSVTGVFFEEGWNHKMGGAGLSTGPAVLNPASLNPQVADWDGPMVSHTVGKDRVRQWVGRGYQDFYYDKLDDGILPGETQVFSFATDINIISLQNMLDAVGTNGYGVAIKMQNLTTDKYAAGWGLVEQIITPDPIQDPEPEQDPQPEDDNAQTQPPQATGVPTPSAALAGLVMMGIAAVRRRRA